MNKRLWIVLAIFVVAFFSGLLWYKASGSDSDAERQKFISEYVKKLDQNKLITKDEIIKAQEEVLGRKLTDKEKDNIIEEHVDGKADSKVTVIMYEDFACSHCQAFSTYAEKIQTDYRDRVQFIMRDFSLSYPNSAATLSAGEAVKQLGGDDAFWKMSKLLFQDETWVGQAVGISQRKELFNKYAKQAGVDVDKFNEALNNTKTNGIDDKIDRDKAIGEKAGVTGTPTWVVNGKKVETLTDSEIRKAIDKALKEADK